MSCTALAVVFFSSSALINRLDHKYKGFGSMIFAQALFELDAYFMLGRMRRAHDTKAETSSPCEHFSAGYRRLSAPSASPQHLETFLLSYYTVFQVKDRLVDAITNSQSCAKH